MEYEDYGKKMLIYASVAIVGVFFALQALFGFPLFKSFESDIKSDARVVIKDASGTCILEASDKIPRVIHNCYNIFLVIETIMNHSSYFIRCF